MDKTFKNYLSTFFVLLFIACVSVLFCSSNSFLYVFKDASFVNYNITVASAMSNGLIPYKDIFTQTGPFALILYMFVNLFPSPFAILTIIEVQTAVIFSYFIYKIVKRYLKEDIITLVATGVITILTYTSASFVSGGMLEELMLPVLAYLLLCVIECIFDKKPFSIFRSILVGIGFAIILWTKFELMLLPILFLIVWTIYSIKNKQVKQWISRLLTMLAINLVVALLFVWYLYFNKAIASFGAHYFAFNFNIIASLLSLAKNAGLIILAILGVVLGLIKNKKDFLAISIIAGLYLVALVFIAEELSNVLPLAIFSQFGVIFIFHWLQTGKYKDKLKNVTLYVIAIVSIVYCAMFSNSIREIDKNVNSYPHFSIISKIAEYKIENPTLLCYKMNDIGLYNDSIQATTQIFASTDYILSNEDLMIKFDKYVQDKTVDFIVAEKQTYEQNKNIFKGKYAFVAEFSYEKIDDFSTENTTLVLLKK